MNAKLQNTPAAWSDPDDAPELTEKFLDKATRMIGDRVVSIHEYNQAVTKTLRGRPMGSTKDGTKQAVTVRYSPEVLSAFRATGPGWQGRMNDALRDWLRTHSPV
jgi:uncharacterized protein (DUF4415 family)